MSKVTRDTIVRTLTRTSAFLRKDIVDFIRQPRLVLALVLGPFLILLLFGLGFKSEPLSLRTLIVVEEDNPLRSYVEQNADNLVQQLILVDIIESEGYARQQLMDGRVDVVIVVPNDVLDKVRSNEQATFQTLHNTIDPMESNYIRAFTNVYVNEANRRALLAAVRQAQQETSEIEPDIQKAREEASELRQAMAEGNEEAAMDQLLQLQRDLTLIQTGLGPTEWLLVGLGAMVSGSSLDEQEALPQDLLAQIQGDLRSLSETESNQIINRESVARAEQLEENLTQLETVMEEFGGTDPSVIVGPFSGVNRTVGRINVDLSDYYVPATIALLLQHLCVTFGALSIVRERWTGTMELFRASPLAPIEILVGKYVSHWLAAAVVALALTLLVFLVMQVPMLGSWSEYAVTLAVLMFASLGLGFAISILARSISQAVQYSMIVLLISVFFSGFFLSLDMLRPVVRSISRAIPAAYAIQSLQDIMLRGQSFQIWRILILTGMGVVLYIVAWLGLRRELT
jgi:ABC-2 type transport system permease protein